MKGLYIAIIVVAIMVAVELAILVPLGLTLREADMNTLNTRLQEITNTSAERVLIVLQQFSHNIAAAAGAVQVMGRFVSQQDLEAILSQGTNPLQSTSQQVFWFESVTDEQRSEFVAFSRAALQIPFYNITELDLTTGGLKPASRRPRYSVVGPSVPAIEGEDRFFLGFDVLTLPDLAPFFNQDEPSLLPHVTLTQTQPNSFGVAVVNEATNRGIMAGIIDSITLIESGLTVARPIVDLVAYASSAVPDEQLLYVEDTPEMLNWTTVDAFVTSDSYAQFFTASVVVSNVTILLGMRFSDAYVTSLTPQLWLIVVVTVSLASLVVDLVVFFAIILFTQLRQRRRISEQRYMLANQMLGYVNHELRNPLQAIVGLSDLAIDDMEELMTHQGDPTLPNKIRSNLGTISRSGLYMRHIINDILDIRRLEEGVIVIQPRPTDIPELLREIERTAAPKLQEKPQLQCHFICAPSCEKLDIDPVRLQQVIFNFLSNAIKFTDYGTISVEICQHVSVVRVGVRDTGRGISSQDQTYLFQPFNQTQTSDATRYGGVGLGLYLVRLLSDLLGARTGVYSLLGVGSMFYLDLPLSVLPAEARGQGVVADEDDWYNGVSLDLSKRN